ncbi:hypothetical protein DL769_011353 [Monosporascus sp. CRB-8-3]|nr:hypothetical protein DL769_011353 [Monosporascus sp. CRB-8-3]
MAPMYLYGSTLPQPGKSYAIHEYSVYEDFQGQKGSSNALTVSNTDVMIQKWEWQPTQEWECVEKDGWLGFICRASTAGKRGAYLGYNAKEYLVCTAQYQDKWEHFLVEGVDGGNQGYWLKMRKEDHLAFVGIVEHHWTKMLRDPTTKWGFTEWT